MEEIPEEDWESQLLEIDGVLYPAEKPEAGTHTTAAPAKTTFEGLQQLCLAKLSGDTTEFEDVCARNQTACAACVSVLALATLSGAGVVGVTVGAGAAVCFGLAGLGVTLATNLKFHKAIVEGEHRALRNNHLATLKRDTAEGGAGSGPGT